MTLGTRLRACAVLPSLSLFIACSTGKPPGDDGWSTGGSTSGSTSGGSSGASGSAASGGDSATGQGGSAASGAGGDIATGGVSGSAATGGTDPAGGTSGDTAVGGSGGVGGTGGDVAGGTGGAAAMGGASGAASGMGGTDPGICAELSVVPTPQVPTVELVVDTSSSMWESTPKAWPVLYGALMDPAAGVVKALEDKIRFGFASYQGSSSAHPETDAACATMTTVDPGLLNRDAIDAAYAPIDAQWMPGAKWETPTNYAIKYATDILTAYMPDPPGPKYILLVTDGNPNTCEKLDPQCGQDLAIKAAQDAYAAGVGLFVLGIGDIVALPNNGCPTSARCGLSHLQDMANAGVGAPVVPAPTCDDPTSTDCQYKYAGCNPNNELTATYTPEAPVVGKPYTVDTSAADAQQQLTDALSELLSNAIACTVEMDAIVTGDPSLGVVQVGGMQQAYNDANGWKLEADAYSVTLQGDACTNFKSGMDLHISFPCDPSGNPIAVHR